MSEHPMSTQRCSGNGLAPMILVAVGDRSLSRVLGQHLEQAGLGVRSAFDRRTTLQALSGPPLDLAVVDVGLPELGGEAAVHLLRARADVPLVLVGARAESADRVRALELGADDFVPAPLVPAELVARVHAVLRRTRTSGSAHRQVRSIGDVVLDEAARSVAVSGHVLELTALEYDLFRFFSHHLDRVLSRKELLERVWGYTIGDGSTVTVLVGRLRGKLGAAGAPDLIQTVRGQGYRLSSAPATGGMAPAG